MKKLLEKFIDVFLDPQMLPFSVQRDPDERINGTIAFCNVITNHKDRGEGYSSLTKKYMEEILLASTEVLDE
jgi:hypothetical protein